MSHKRNSLSITFNELIHHMMLDPYYGIESDETTSLIKNIYEDRSDDVIYVHFMKRFSFLPCKSDEQRHLIYIWCGLMGLPTYLNGKPSNWQRQNILEHWKADFEIHLEEIKDFLRQKSWPLPITLFPNEPDNTKRKLELSKNEYEHNFHIFSVVLPKLEEELEEIKGIQPGSMEERRTKKEEISRLEQQISTITGEEQTSPTVTSTPSSTENRFVLTGDHWSVTFQSKTKTFANTKGMRYIEHLIRHQENEISVSDLYYAINPVDSEATDPIHSAMSAEQLEDNGLPLGKLWDAGDILSPEGKRRLKRELQKITDKIEDAKEFGNDEQQEKLETQQEQLIRHIATATGLGGRTRKASSVIEKIRVNVTKRIRTDIRKKILPSHPDLGKHLDQSIRTGTFCQYVPHQPIEWIFDSE